MSCCDDWPIKTEQQTDHPKHAVTNLDLLLVEPDSVSTHYPLGHMMSWLITHRHTHTLLQIGQTLSPNTDIDTDAHNLRIPYHLVSLTHTHKPPGLLFPNPTDELRPVEHAGSCLWVSDNMS